jgi:hypothetical protein
LSLKLCFPEEMNILEDFFCALNKYSEAVQVVSTTILVVITPIYVWLTNTLSSAASAELQNQAKATRAKREELLANSD